MSELSKQELNQKLAEILKKIHDEEQDKPNQYVIAYYRKDNDRLIGYHYSTFCQLTNDILEAKRYNGENPYKQLRIICDNVKYILTDRNTSSMFYEFNIQIQKQFHNLSPEDVYVDAIYLADGSPKQDFRCPIIL